MYTHLIHANFFLLFVFSIFPALVESIDSIAKYETYTANTTPILNGIRQQKTHFRFFFPCSLTFKHEMILILKISKGWYKKSGIRTHLDWIWAVDYTDKRERKSKEKTSNKCMLMISIPVSGMVILEFRELNW